MIGNQPSLTNNAVARTISVTATAGQTLFTVTGGYRINQLGVFRNGTRLVDALDYNARDGATVTLLSPANASDVLEFQVFDDFRVADALNVNSGGTVNGAVTIVSAATTALLVEGNARVTGILTVGNSSITFDGTNNSINIGSVSIAETGITGGTSDIVTRNITGVAATFTGNVSIAGTLTYEDVTNIDSVGLITARSGIVLTGGNVTLGTGVTASGSTANTFTLSTNGSERLRVDSSGNINADSGVLYVDAGNNRVGVGTTTPGSIFDVKPSASSSTLRIETGTINSDSVRLSAGGTVNTYLEYRGYLGHAWFVDTTERARIDSAGRLLVGTSSAFDANTVIQAKAIASVAPGILDLQANFTSNIAGQSIGAIRFLSGDNAYRASIFCVSDGDSSSSSDAPGRIVFATTSAGASSPTERMRILQSGDVQLLGPGNVFSVESSGAPGTTVRTIFSGHSSTGFGSRVISFQVWNNGNVQNTNNSYGAISDIKLKENIVDANSQWADIKSLQVRNYNLKEGQTHRQIGLIAQEVEPISPGLVYESPDRDADGNDLGTVTKSVNYSVLYMKAVKALQEAMERIEVLEAEVASLKAS